MPNQRVRVRKDKVLACMTCPLCKNVVEDATTISLCFHTFCRKCIYDKFSDEECESCPVCDINLGCNPVDKLRPDHNLQDIRAKIFPIENQAVKALSSVPSVSPPVAKRKERSLSSLVVDSPRMPSHSSVTGRRKRAGGRKPSAVNRSSPANEEPPRKNEEHSEVEEDEDSESPEALNEIAINKMEPSTSTKSSNSQVPGSESDNPKQMWETKTDLWEPLNCLLEVTNQTKFSTSVSPEPSYVKTEQPSAPDTDLSNSVMDIKENGCKQEAQDSKISVPTSVSDRSKFKKRVRKFKKNATVSPADSLAPPQFVLECTKQLLPNPPIWFSLVASGDLEANEPLPQIATNFLRIKNGNMPVSLIQKYIAIKLNLPNDTEVEIMCQGQSVLPSLQLRSLLELWLTTTAHNPAKRIKTSVGSSGKDYVMVLSYARKAQRSGSGAASADRKNSHDKDANSESPLDKDSTSYPRC